MSMEIGCTYSTVELKTSKPGVTKTTQIKTGFRNINDYTRYLQGRYSYMNSGQTSMLGVPVTVSVSGAFLAKCNRDPERAKFLEENLAAIPDCVRSMVDHTKAMPGSPVCTYASYIIDDEGNITCMSGCTNDPDGKIAKENAERRVNERRKAEKKQEAARREKAALERLRKKRLQKELRVSANGKSVHEATDCLMEKLPLNTLFTKAVGFDLKI